MSNPTPKPERERGPLRGLVIGVGGALFLFALVAWGLARLTGSPDSQAVEDAASQARVTTASVEPGGQGAPAPLIEGFALLGESEAPSSRERCSADARAQMEAFTVELQGADVVVREEAWQRRGTSARVSVAGWYSLCTRDGRAVRIVGDDSRAVLAEYHPRLGYLEPGFREPGFHEPDIARGDLGG